MSAGEIAGAMKEAGINLELTDPDYHASSTAAVYQRRWKPVIEAYEAIGVEAIEAEALWGA